MVKKDGGKQRGSRDMWLEAAYELLVSAGIEGVKVMPLAKKLNLTRTGFYWFFEDLSELHAAMIERWEGKNTASLVARCRMDADNLGQALFNLIDCWFDPALFDARLDLSIRNWARSDPHLKLRLKAADQTRIEAVTEMFRRFGYPPEQARVRSMAIIYAQVGYISMEVEEDPVERLRRVQDYVEVFAGHPPFSEDVEAFERRHSCDQGVR